MTILASDLAVNIPIGPFLDSSDGITPMTGLTLTAADVWIFKHGASDWVNVSTAQTLTHLRNGWYLLALSAEDTEDAGTFMIHVNEAGALPWFKTDIQIQHPYVWDALYPATHAMVADLFAVDFELIPTPNVAGVPITDLKYFLGVEMPAGTEPGVPPVNVGFVGGTLQTAGDVTAAVTNIQSRLPSSLINGRMDAIAGAIGNDVITSATIAASGVTAIQSGLATAAALTTVDTVVDAILVTTAKLDTALELDVAVWRFTINSLEQAPSGTGASADAIADEVETRTLFAVTTAGTVNALAANSITDTAIAASAITEIQAGLATAAALTTVGTNVTTIDGIVDTILVTTNKLDDTLEDDGGTFRFTTNSLEQAPSGTGASAATIADEVQTRTLFAVTTVNGFAADSITNTALAASAVTEIQSGLATAAALTAVDTVVDAIKVTTDKLDTALELDVAVWRFTVNALEQAPSGTGASAAAIADEVQTRTIAGVTTVGTVNALAADSVNASALNANAVTEIQAGLATSAALTTVGTNVSTVLTNLATVDTVVDAVQVVTDRLQTAMELDAAVWRFTVNALEQAPTNVTSLANGILTSAVTDSTFVTEVQSGLATQALLQTVEDAIDTEIPNITALLTPEIATIATDVAAIRADLIDGGRLDLLIDAIKAKTDQVPDAVRINTATGGGASSVTLDAGASATDDFYVNSLVRITSGPALGQTRFVVDYNGNTKIATVDSPWIGNNPGNGAGFQIIGFSALAAAEAEAVAEAVMTIDWDTITGEPARCALNALRKLRNKVEILSGVMSVYEESGTVVAYTQNVTQTPGANPITALGN